ncbi:MAG TPA: nickel-binding protein [Polyangiaceae bacterium]
MTEVLVERHAEQPLSELSMFRMSEAGSGCMDLHRVHWNRSLLSADGRELICHFSAADLESVRLVLKAQGSLRAEVWACSWRDAPGLSAHELAQANVFASWRFNAPIAPEELESIDASAAVCLRNHRVRFLRTFLASDRRRVICLCLAADAESVRLALRDAKPPVERVWAFRHFQP